MLFVSGKDADSDLEPPPPILLPSSAEGSLECSSPVPHSSAPVQFFLCSISCFSHICKVTVRRKARDKELMYSHYSAWHCFETTF